MKLSITLEYDLQGYVQYEKEQDLCIVDWVFAIKFLNCNAEF